MSIADLMKSERAIVVLLYLGGLLALMLTDSKHVTAWGQYAGAIVAIYTAAKSIKPNDTTPTLITMPALVDELKETP